METKEAEAQTGSYNDFKEAMGIKTDEQTPAPEQPQEQPAEEPKAEETPQEEPKAEEPTENKQEVETPAAEDGGEEEPKAEEPKDGEEKEEEPAKETVFDINEINKRFSTEFKDDSELKARLEQADRVAELEEQLKELDSLKEKNTLLEQSIDPMNYFSSEDAYKVEQFKKQFPDKDATTAYALFTQDVGEMSDIDVLAYETLLDNPGIDKDTVLEVVRDKYNIEEGEDLDKTSAAKVKIDANQARRSINSLKSEVKLPDKVDADALVDQQKELLAEKTERLKDGWSGVAKELVSNLPDYVLKDDDGSELFRYSVKDFPQDKVDDMVNLMVNSGVELNKDAAQSMMDVMQKEYFFENRDQIAKSIREDAINKAEEERLKKQHNPGQPKAEAEPKPDTKKDGQEQLKSDLASKGWQPKKLFK